ncbi:MAG TPA: homoserine kinase [Erysipelotrichaceae bacterium]|nr:homoserine kinase [Erysipelotrichaceae bacterium]
MAEIRTPATAANIGPGFDCLGMALGIWNTFHVQKAADTKLINVEERFNNSDNLFLQAYRRGCGMLGENSGIIAEFNCEIPVARGLGSSASMIIGGLKAASILHGDRLSENDILQAACDMEGHPDNTAPCLLGGLTATMRNVYREWIPRRLQVSGLWNITLLIPDFEVNTDEAREILPDMYSRRIIARNTANVVMLTEALRTGDAELLRHASKDRLHEPYRSRLIPDYDTIHSLCVNDAGGALVISGSGPALLLISPRQLSESACAKIEALPNRWKIVRTELALQGTQSKGDPR